MKFLHIFWLSFFLTFKLIAPEIKFANTQDLLPIAKDFGIDSAINLVSGFPLYQIDSITALGLVGLIKNYERYSRNDLFFSNMAHNWKNKLIEEKTNIFAINQLKRIESAQPNKYGGIMVLDDRIIISIIYQRPDLIENQLIHTYTTCSGKADSLRKEFPSIIVRFFKSFKYGTLPIIETYKDYHKNCYRIMWTLGQLEDQYFDPKKLRYHKSQLRKWEQDKDLLSSKVTLNEYETQILNLNHSYSSIKDIDFRNEPELNLILRNFDLKDKCWKFILYKKNLGFMDLGCSYAPLAGHGIQFKIELIDNNKIKLTVIGSWIS